jgi:hypothetical protein
MEKSHFRWTTFRGAGQLGTQLSINPDITQNGVPIPGTALEHVQRLSGLLPACSACKSDVTISADPNAIFGVVDGVMQIAREMKCAEGNEYQVELALREALANASSKAATTIPARKWNAAWPALNLRT